MGCSPLSVLRDRVQGEDSNSGLMAAMAVVELPILVFTWGQNGFEELRRYIKQGGDFCKDLSTVLHERSEAEMQYSKTLSKLSAKLLKLTKESSSTINTAWQRAAVEMEAQSEIHRVFATVLTEEVVKPLKALVENQHRSRKAVEAAVDKTGKSLAEWRSAECKAKKQSFQSARENERMQDAMLDVRIAGVQSPTASTLHLHNTKLVSDKENAKMESKRRKAEDSVKKADVEYYTYCIRAERARLEWESAVLRGSQCFQSMEEERLQQLKELTDSYLHHYKDVGPKLTQSAARLVEPVNNVSVVSDLETLVALRETGQPVPEQLLPDFYAEHITLAMNRERRRQALVKLLQLIRQDLERERRGKQGVENLARALKQTPTFGTDDSQQNVTEKLHHMRSMLAYLEAARYKVQGALAEMEGRNKESHPLASHIHMTRDRQGLQQSILKVPIWVRNDSMELPPDNIEWSDRGTADGNSVQPDSDFDEFSSQGSERDYQSSVLSQFPVLNDPTPCAGRCKALYHYAANLYDELNLNPGDVINIHDKQADGWWLGELNGVVGIFPATYVEEIK
ncbi:nostrin isoform X2 [Homalodisca vitripennis]|uniref:nostrin isoform X2 n=1 Tax=Homalodisca vitripennis TaxID=197043 RepID=UPI001EEA0772|nr:nostrin isoform X2 [Homalodisca vitripennis]